MLPGLVIGVVSMLLLVIYRASRPHIGVLGRVPGVAGAYGDLGRHPEYEPIPGLLVVRLESPLFYANATLVRDHVKHLVGANRPTPAAVVLDVGANSDLDITSADTLEELIGALQAAGIDVAVADVRQPVIDMLHRSRLVSILRREPDLSHGS